MTNTPNTPAHNHRQRGSALVEAMISMLLILLTGSGVAWVVWTLSLRVLMQTMADETASIIAHQQVTSLPWIKRPTHNQLAESLREDIVGHLRKHPLVPRWLGPNLGLRVQTTTDPDGMVRTQLTLCIQRDDKTLWRTGITDHPSRPGAAKTRDCLGQFTAGPTAADASHVLSLRSLHPPLISQTIVANGLSDLPLAEERRHAIATLLPGAIHAARPKDP